MLNELVRFADDTAGLEKGLRLFQGFCTIAVGLAEAAEDVEMWLRLRSQFALGRRYFRLLKWHPCWSNAVAAISADKRPLNSALEVAKWSFLGMYFFLEMFTISNAMGATAYEWAPKVQLEANRCWFIALVFSILLSLYNLLFPELPSPPPTPGKTMDGSADEKTNGYVDAKNSEPKTADQPQPSQNPAVTKIISQLAIDCCDLFIPGAAVGWIPVGPLLIGTASTISTSIAGRQIWNRVQQKARR